MKRLIGSKKSAFDEDISLRPAKLIPLYKAGDEMALTSIFLSTLRLVREFKREFFADIKMFQGGKVHVYTEITFPGFEDSRVDGLIIVVSGGTIKDAALLEMKNKNDKLNEPQILKYQQIAKQWCIPKLITVSNEFVATPTQSPLNIKSPKNVSMYHFSWLYLLTIAHLLLFKNDNNIADEDQVEIMKEVVDYCESKTSGILGFTRMKPGWKETAEN